MRLRWINVVLGAWFLVTAFLAGPRSPAFGDHLFLGLAIFLFAVVAMGIPRLRIVNVLLGAWAIVSPFVFGYAGAPMAVNDIVLGIVVLWVASTAPTPPRQLLST